MKRLGYVLWFDDTSGEGMIRDAKTMRVHYVHWSAIKTAQKSFIREWKTLKDTTPVEFTIYRNLYSSQVDTVWEIGHDLTIESEWKLNRLMNFLFENGDASALDIADNFYKAS